MAFYKTTLTGKTVAGRSYSILIHEGFAVHLFFAYFTNEKFHVCLQPHFPHILLLAHLLCKKPATQKKK